ncbi:unnamed protein product [Oppiella nova]|uniref:Uncharacterized protein n=1 Tax=Oppiella nova TaxID=334625 RepID=A0A7R9M4T8_9ACAR|nr:unnamed protein product [Oppiella nova]CAG2169474.1 unnamed protein product [Oppiella nova]
MLDKVLERTVMWKRWTLLALCCIGIASTIIISGVSLAIVDTIDSGDTNHTEEAVHTMTVAKSSAKIMIIVSTVITILVDIFAFFGGYKNSYYMTLTYIILMVLIGLGSILIGFRTECWYTTIFHFLILGLAYDLRLIKNKAFIHHHKQQLKEQERHKHWHKYAPVVVVTCGQPLTPGSPQFDGHLAHNQQQPYTINIQPAHPEHQQQYYAVGHSSDLWDMTRPRVSENLPPYPYLNDQDSKIMTKKMP